MSIPGSVSDFQPGRRVPEELYNDSRNLAASSGIQRRRIEKSGSEEPWQPMLLPCFSRKAEEKSLDDRYCLESMTHHAAGIGSSRKPSRKSRMPRNSRGDLSVPGHVFDCQPARRDPDDYTMIQEIWQHHQEF